MDLTPVLITPNTSGSSSTHYGITGGRYMLSIKGVDDIQKGNSGQEGRAVGRITDK